MVLSLLDYDDDGSVIQSSLVPVVDGGTEGFKGNARVILPGITACVECTLDLFPPQVTLLAHKLMITIQIAVFQVNFPLCTIAHTPRLPEHCIEYVRILLWPKENPFSNPGEDPIAIDGDDPQHITWIFEKSLERANHVQSQHLSIFSIVCIFSTSFPVWNQGSDVSTYSRRGQADNSCCGLYQCCHCSRMRHGGLQIGHLLCQPAAKLHGVQRCGWDLHLCLRG